MMSNLDVDFSGMLLDMQQLLEQQPGEEQNVMCDYHMRYTSIDGQFIYHLIVEQRENLPPDVLQADALDELISDITIADIEMDVSDTKDTHGELEHPDCLKIKFSFEDGNVLIVDGIAYEVQEDHGELFTEFVMPVVIEYLKSGTFELIEIIEYEE